MTTFDTAFEAITITGFYTRDIRFPVFHVYIEIVNSANIG